MKRFRGGLVVKAHRLLYTGAEQTQRGGVRRRRRRRRQDTIPATPASTIRELNCPRFGNYAVHVWNYLYTFGLAAAAAAPTRHHFIPVTPAYDSYERGTPAPTRHDSGHACFDDSGTNMSTSGVIYPLLDSRLRRRRLQDTIPATPGPDLSS